MGEHDMPRTTEEFRNYVANELRAGDRRMDEIVNTVAQIQAEQASAKVLLAANTETIALADAPAVAARLLAGQVRGRVVVDVNA